jgi:hypothetical protein
MKCKMEVTVIETNKGHKSILCEGFRYRLNVETKSGDLSWRCYEIRSNVLLKSQVNEK